MTIQVLTIDVDGTQFLRSREVPDDYFDPLPPPAPLTEDEIPYE